jgi:hypothetical protein
MSHYDISGKESKDRNTIKEMYTKLLNVCLGIEFFLIISELGIVGSSIALPAVIPFSVPISIGLTSCSIILRSSSRLIAKKINKHLEIESLARAKFNSTEETFTKAVQDGKITDEEFNDIEREIKNYENMKLNILNKYNSDRTEVWDSLKKNYKS